MRASLIALLTAAALAAAGVLAATGFSGDGTAEPAGSFDTRYKDSRGAPALRAATGARPGVVRARPGVTIRHLVTRRSFAVDTNFILRIVCPRGFEPLGGGTLSGPGLAISNSSRFHPETRAAQKRSWYVGVTNLTDEEQRFRGTIVCIKGS